jgi:hypothetical protein
VWVWSLVPPKIESAFSTAKLSKMVTHALRHGKVSMDEDASARLGIKALNRNPLPAYQNMLKMSIALGTSVVESLEMGTISKPALTRAFSPR